MSNVYVTSDWHLGHKGIADRFRTQFNSDAHHDTYIVEGARERLGKNDLLICVGDMSFTVEGMEMIDSLPGRKVLVRGNHDTLREVWYQSVFEAVHGAMAYKGVFITHIPIHPMELYRRANVHGHCHKGGPYELQKGEKYDRYFNAILEFNDYNIVPWKKVEERLNK